MFIAHLFGRSRRGDREEVLLKLFTRDGEPVLDGELGDSLPSGGPGVLVREEEDGDATWAEVQLMTNVKGVVVWDGTGSQPDRPDVLSNEWIQIADPAAVAEDGDTWVEPEV